MEKKPEPSQKQKPEPKQEKSEYEKFAELAKQLVQTPKKDLPAKPAKSA